MVYDEKRKNLERAIILGLILSTSVYANVWAANVDSIQNSSYNNDDNGNNPFSENVFVEANTTGEDDSIGNIILRDDKQYTVNISTTGGDIAFEKNDGTGILVADGIASGTTVKLSASGDIIINAAYGIQANSSNRDKNNKSLITLSAQNNNITASEIGVYGIGKVDVELNAKGNNNIISSGDFAVRTDANSAGVLNIIAKTGDNSIIAKSGSAIRANGNKVITVQANEGTNFIIGAINGIQHNEEGQVENGGTLSKDSSTKYVIIKGVNNIIYGGENGLISDGAGITDITASESNIIGQYTDEDKNVYTSNTGINVTEGTVNVKAENGNNNIYANINGIIVNGENSKVDLNGKNNIITLNTNSGSGSGISAINGGDVNIEAKFDDNSNFGNIVIDVDTAFDDDRTVDFYGIKAIDSSNVRLTADKNVVITMNVNDKIPSTSGRNTGGLVAENKSTSTISSGGYFYLESTVNTAGTNAAYALTKNYGIKAADSSEITITTNGHYQKDDLELGAVVIAEGRHSEAITAENSKLTMNINDGGLYVTNKAQDNDIAFHNKNSEKIDINVANGDIYILSSNNSPKLESQNSTYTKGIYNELYTDNKAITEISANNLVIESIAKGDNTKANSAWGIHAVSSSKEENLINNLIDIDVNNLSIIARSDAVIGNSFGIESQSGNVDIDATGGISINAQYGIYAEHQITNKNIGANIDLNSQLNNTITATTTGVYANGINTVVNLTGQNNAITTTGSGINATSASNINLTANQGINNVQSGNSASGIISNGQGTKVALTAMGNTVSANTGIYGLSYGKVTLTANVINNEITTTVNGIYAQDTSNVELAAHESSNIIKAGKIDEKGFGNQNAVYAISGGTVTLDAGYTNKISGVVYASGTGSKIDMKKFVPTTSTLSLNNTDKDSTEVSNYVYSAAVVANAGDIDTTTEANNKFFNKKFVSSLYAEDGANIELTGENYIGTWANNTLPEYLERTVWAYAKDDDVASTIKISGAAQIGTDNYEISPNSADVAIAAGTATDLNKTKVDSFDENDKRSTVTVEYDNFAGGGNSSISGDILSAYAGLVDIKAKKDSNAGIRIEGNLLAGNNGILNINLGNGGYFEGRTDDYQDAGNAEEAGTVASDEHLKFYDPAFSSTIYSSGKIDLNMGQGSTWNVTGQSWVTTLSGEGIIDMRNDNENLNSGVTTTANANENTSDNNSHAVHIGTLTGKHTFVMDLNDTSHDISDMLYIKDEANSSGTHKVFLNSVAGLEDMKDGDKLRFATVNAGEDQLIFEGEYNGENGYTGSKSRAMLNNTGFNNVAFDIKNETYSTSDKENAGYNGDTFDLTKPGNEYVDKEYGNTATNWYLTRNSSGDEMSDGGKTILNMSRANYSNAIYMDRLNKRLGEARYINAEEDEGMWVRIRQDRIGKDDAYRSQNTMYELGYDQKQESDNGERRVGFAVDYMHGDTSYSDIAGKGEIDRYGLWLYDTWMGDKGHYVDYVAKWGHLSNDFEIYNSREKVDGDYSNNVFSVSAEYGRKKDIGNDWYFEPQAQLQLARVTGADYTTTQGTKVSVDGINSLIGRAGFRIGKDFGEQKQSTLYFKADVLHEFLGDQTIRALDATTGGNWQSVDYDNQGTWYDIGIGYAAMMSKNSYAFIDLEQSFGNDNEETYQINAGVQWSF